ncbi:hypothetical protein CCMA1212_002457 [Trichoderma ghanense]|uniref:Uncharacterized protein n=1 Tax=Trichoderma ghanense TaxID=65468 RepID=A0ABY2HCJ2_9HYPO
MALRPTVWTKSQRARRGQQYDEGIVCHGSRTVGGLCRRISSRNLAGRSNEATVRDVTGDPTGETVTVVQV